jgi:hypothetical protein
MDYHIATYSLLGRANGPEDFTVFVRRAPNADSAKGGEEPVLIASLHLTQRDKKAAAFDVIPLIHPVPDDLELLPDIEGLLTLLDPDRVVAGIELLSRADNFVTSKIAPKYDRPDVESLDGTLVLRAKSKSMIDFSARRSPASEAENSSPRPKRRKGDVNVCI